MESAKVEEEFGRHQQSILKEMKINAETTGDFSIKVEGKKIPCHKQVLAAFSPVMKGLLNSGMKESVENQLYETTFSYETMETVVHFMYNGGNGEVETLYKTNANMMNVLKAAHYYEIPLLMKACQYALVNKLTSENSIDCFRVADLLSADILKKVKHKKNLNFDINYF